MNRVGAVIIVTVFSCLVLFGEANGLENNNIGNSVVDVDAPPSPGDICSNDISCPSCDAYEGKSNVDTIFYFGPEKPSKGINEFRRRMTHLERMMLTSAKSLFVEPPVAQHTTLNYFCCLTKPQVKTVVDVLSNLVWKPINFTFSSISCNNDFNATHRSILAMTSNETSNQLFDLVRQVEDAVTAAGVPIIQPRMRPFHSTLGQVRLSFDVDKMIPKMQEEVPIINSEPFTAKSFSLLPHIFHATTTTVEEEK